MPDKTAPMLRDYSSEIKLFTTYPDGSWTAYLEEEGTRNSYSTTPNDIQAHDPNLLTQLLARTDKQDKCGTYFELSDPTTSAFIDSVKLIENFEPTWGSY